MANNMKCPPELVERMLASYRETHSYAETGRRLGVTGTTVRQYMRHYEGLCNDCPATVPYDVRYCSDCLKRRTAWMKERRKDRRRAGLCAECDEVIQPPSTQFCATHRVNHQRRSETYAQKISRERQVSCTGIPIRKQRNKHLRYAYGQAGIDAWDRDQGRCVLCFVSHEERAVHIHHIDRNHDNNVKENLTLLCLRCHRLTHLLVEHARPHHVVRWFLSHYPDEDISQVLRQQSRTRRTAPQSAPAEPELFAVS